MARKIVKIQLFFSGGMRAKFSPEGNELDSTYSLD